jgi:hypothetical protein
MKAVWVEPEDREVPKRSINGSLLTCRTYVGEWTGSRDFMRSAPTGSGKASYLQPEPRVSDAGYVQDAFILNLQLLSTNTLTETSQETISVGSRLPYQYKHI